MPTRVWQRIFFSLPTIASPLIFVFKKTLRHFIALVLKRHGRCVNDPDSILMDQVDEDPFPIDRFEVQGYVNTEVSIVCLLVDDLFP